MSLVVWEYEKNVFYYVNIGDSRIYKVSDGSAGCLSSDEAKFIPTAVQTSLGKRIIQVTQLTNFIGKHNLEHEVRIDNICKCDLLLLATDGFYNARKSSFEKRIIELGASKTLESDFPELVRKFEILASDDMTAIVIRKL